MRKRGQILSWIGIIWALLQTVDLSAGTVLRIFPAGHLSDYTRHQWFTKEAAKHAESAWAVDEEEATQEFARVEDTCDDDDSEERFALLASAVPLLAIDRTSFVCPRCDLLLLTRNRLYILFHSLKLHS